MQWLIVDTMISLHWIIWSDLNLTLFFSLCVLPQNELQLGCRTCVLSLRPHVYQERWIVVSTSDAFAWATTIPSSILKNGAVSTAAPPIQCGPASSAPMWPVDVSWRSTHSNTFRSQPTHWLWRCVSWTSSVLPAETMYSMITQRETSNSSEGRSLLCAAQAGARYAPRLGGMVDHSPPCSWPCVTGGNHSSGRCYRRGSTNIRICRISVKRNLRKLEDKKKTWKGDSWKSLAMSHPERVLGFLLRRHVQPSHSFLANFATLQNAYLLLLPRSLPS